MNARVQNRATLSADSSYAPLIGGVIQRTCACGNHALGRGCEGCTKRRETVLQRSSPPSMGDGWGEGGTVPPIVDEALRSPRQPLDSATRAFFKPHFGGDFSRVRVHGRAGTAMQPKLVIGDPADRYEQEADAIAEQVMRMADSRISDEAVNERISQVRGGEPPSERERLVQRQMWNPYSIDEGQVEEKEREEEAEFVQTKAVSSWKPGMVPEAAVRIEALQAGGEPLSTPVRTVMERRFGYDFSKVQVRNGSAAQEAAASVNARAFAIGQTVVFGAGQYSPGSESGRRLIAHELTHVVQHGGVPRVSASVMRASVHKPVSQSGLEGSRSRDGAVAGPVTPHTTQDSQTIRRVKWHPNRATGKTSFPWGSGPNGDILEGATDARTTIDIWRPHDGTTYWCHGYTFGGKSARGGPYSLWGSDVPTVLKDDGWKQTYSCMARPKDILIFWDDTGILTHSGIIRKVSTSGGRVSDTTSTLESKWGNGPHNTSSWETNAKNYGKYRCYSKSPLTGVCSGMGANER